MIGLKKQDIKALNHQFTLIFDELKREKFVDWYGYSASVSPYILNQFEQEVGYKFRPEYSWWWGRKGSPQRGPSWHRRPPPCPGCP